MRLVENKHGVFYLSFYDGKRSQSVSLRTKDRNEAMKAAAARMPSLITTRQANVQPSIADILDGYHRDRNAVVVNKEALDSIVGRLKVHFGHLTPLQLTSKAITAYAKKRNLKPGSLRRELGTMTAALNYAVKRHVLPAGSILPIEMPPASPPRQRWLSVEELDRVLIAAREIREASRQPDRLSRIERWLWLATETGARRSAIVELRWSAVDLQRGLVDFANGQDLGRKKKRATVPISDRLRPILERASQERRPRCPYVLDTSACIRYMFKAVMRRAGVEGVSPHTIRHSVASHLVMNGTSYTDVSRILGNSAAIVERVYAHHNPEYLRTAVNWRR